MKALLQEGSTLATRDVIHTRFPVVITMLKGNSNLAAEVSQHLHAHGSAKQVSTVTTKIKIVYYSAVSPRHIRAQQPSNIAFRCQRSFRHILGSCCLVPMQAPLRAGNLASGKTGSAPRSNKERRLGTRQGVLGLVCCAFTLPEAVIFLFPPSHPFSIYPPFDYDAATSFPITQPLENMGDRCE